MSQQLSLNELNTAADTRSMWGGVPRREPYLLRSCALSVSSLAVGYVCMTAATNIWLLLPSVVLRSLGSATLWIYSTLLLQFRVPNEIQGEPERLQRSSYLQHKPTAAHLGAVCIPHLRRLDLFSISAHACSASSKGRACSASHDRLCAHENAH